MGFILLMTPIAINAQDVIVSAKPVSKVVISGQQIAVSGQQITVPVIVDISMLPELLGSYTAELNWDENTLKYISHSPGNTAGFGSPVVNTAKTTEGKLYSAAANPLGAKGQVNVLNLVFEVIGQSGANCKVDLKFTAMASAYTFKNLLPYISATSNITTGLEVMDLPEDCSVVNYPNPFNDGTKITYKLRGDGHVNLWINNVLGQKIRILVNDFKQAGTYEIFWDGKDDKGQNVPIGIYVCTFQAGDFLGTKKMQLVK